MKRIILGTLTLIAPLVVSAQTTIFSDTFTTSTMGAASPAAPTATATDYEVASTKNANLSSIATGNLDLKLNAATTSGLAELQALFTTSPVTLANNGDYIDLVVTFTDNANLLAGGTSSYLYAGLYSSGGVGPVSGNQLANSGLTATAGSAFATGNAASWKGYATRISNGGTSGTWVRPLQNGAGTTSGNQDLLGNNASNGSTYNNPTGSQIGSSQTSTVTLAGTQQYTLDYRLTYDGSANLTISDILYSGVGTGGSVLFSQSVIATGSTLVDLTFDGLALGFRNSGTSLAPDMSINSLTAVTNVPEPGSVALVLGGLGLLAFVRRVSR